MFLCAHSHLGRREIATSFDGPHQRQHLEGPPISHPARFHVASAGIALPRRSMGETSPDGAVARVDRDLKSLVDRAHRDQQFADERAVFNIGAPLFSQRSAARRPAASASNRCQAVVRAPRWRDSRVGKAVPRSEPRLAAAAAALAEAPTAQSVW